jgi:tRNA A-37 threonylcarbamoyl transferase component Bud32
MVPGDAFGKYTIEADLGEGGMGRVYVARDPVLERRVALKVVRPDERDDEAARTEANARLFREARAAAKLDHPNVVAVFDMGEIEGTPYLAMELVKGRTLREAAADPSVPVERKLGWLTDVARALAAAHRAGIVHRDVKPENVMVRDDGVIKVLDFGIARRVRAAVDPQGSTASAALATLTREGVSVGTPLYMTPEQIRGDEVDGRSDQFAWAVMAHEVLGGEVPWKSKNDALGLVASILTQPAPGLRAKVKELPGEVDEVIARCLSKSPGDRFASMDEVIAALQGAVASRATGRLPASVTPSGAGAPGADGAARTTGQRRYSDDEIRKIVERATELQGNEGALSHQELLDVAREVGLDEGAVSAAAREIAREKKAAKRGDAAAGAGGSAAVEPVAAPPPALQKTSRTAQRWRDFFRHLMSFLVVNGFIYYFLSQPAWQRWMLFGWGMGVLLHLASTLFPESEEKKKKERTARRSGRSGSRGRSVRTRRARVRRRRPSSRTRTS